MTNEEAKKWVFTFLSPTSGNRFAEEMIEAGKLACKALEKQIPKKPIMEKSNIVCFDEFYCPSCKKRIIYRLDGEWIAGKTQKHCDECGQALDWGYDNDKR